MIDPAKPSIYRLAFEIAIFVAVVVADAYGLVPITQTIFLLPLIWVMLRLSGEHWSTIGFTRPDRFGWSIVAGVVAGVLMELFAVYVTTPWISTFVGVEPDYSDLKDIRGNLTMLFLFLGLSWTLAAFGEEICFRGFLMKRLAQVFGESRVAWIASLLLSTVLFGYTGPLFGKVQALKAQFSFSDREGSHGTVYASWARGSRLGSGSVIEPVFCRS